MERRIRKLKRFSQGTFSPDTAKAYRKKLRQAQQELKVFVDEHNDVLRRDYSREKYYGGSLTDKEKDDIININNSCYIHPDKINEFLLKPNAKHSKEFFDVGYTPDDYEKLNADLINGYSYDAATDKKVTDNGVEKFSIFMELGVDKKKRFRTVWQKDTPVSTPRIITAHRED